MTVCCCVQVAAVQLHLVAGVKAGAHGRVSSFFSTYGEQLLQGQGAETWSKWFALPYLSREAAQSQFRVRFDCASHTRPGSPS